MRVSRLYVSFSLAVGQQVALDEDNAHYVRTVLRLRQSAEVILFNGLGGEYLGKIDEVSRKSVLITMTVWTDRSVESHLKVTLGLGIARGDRMDFSVQKAVELGVNAMTPLITERCQVQIKGEKKVQRLLHWQKIAQHATEQSGRTCLPILNNIEHLTQWVGQQKGLKVFLDPYADKSLNDLTPIEGHVTLLTGPEGGFSAVERDIAKAAGFIPVRMGARILRTETASLAALAAVQVLWGDFGIVEAPSSTIVRGIV